MNRNIIQQEYLVDSDAIRRFGSRSRGFTLIELMVVIGIFSLITGAMLANFRGGERQEELRLAAEGLAQSFRQVQGMVVTGQTYEKNGEQVFPPDGYGLKVSSPREGVWETVVTAGSAVALSTTRFPSSVVVAEYRLREQNGTEQRVQVTQQSFFVAFRPPDARLILLGPSVTENTKSVTVVLKHTATEATREVTLHAGTGRIEAE